MLAEAQDVGEQNLQMYVCEIYIDISHTVVINSWSRMLEWGKTAVVLSPSLLMLLHRGSGPGFLEKQILSVNSRCYAKIPICLK